MASQHLNVNGHEGRKYLRLIRPADGKGQPILVDVYAVLEAFQVTCPALAHLAKKVLVTGQRGKGTTSQDLQGALAALSRAIDLQHDREFAEEEAKRKSDERAGVKAKEPRYMDDVRAAAAQQEG